MSSFLSLPIYEIFNNLSLKSVLTVSQVNKALQSIGNSEEYWRYRYLQRTDRSDTLERVDISNIRLRYAVSVIYDGYLNNSDEVKYIWNHRYELFQPDLLPFWARSVVNIIGICETFDIAVQIDSLSLFEYAVSLGPCYDIAQWYAVKAVDLDRKRVADFFYKVSDVQYDEFGLAYQVRYISSSLRSSLSGEADGPLPYYTSTYCVSKYMNDDQALAFSQIFRDESLQAPLLVGRMAGAVYRHDISTYLSLVPNFIRIRPDFDDELNYLAKELGQHGTVEMLKLLDCLWTTKSDAPIEEIASDFSYLGIMMRFLLETLVETVSWSNFNLAEYIFNVPGLELAELKTCNFAIRSEAQYEICNRYLPSGVLGIGIIIGSNPSLFDRVELEPTWITSSMEISPYSVYFFMNLKIFDETSMVDEMIRSSNIFLYDSIRSLGIMRYPDLQLDPLLENPFYEWENVDLDLVSHFKEDVAS